MDLSPRLLPYPAMLDGRKRVHREVTAALRAEMSARLGVKPSVAMPSAR